MFKKKAEPQFLKVVNEGKALRYVFANSQKSQTSN